MWDFLIINPMVNILLWIYSLIGNFGVAIILFTLLIRLLTHPLTVQQMKSAQLTQEFQKSAKWQELQKKYKDDKQKLQQEQMKLYQEMGINPLGSCLPTLIQFPIIIGLYQAIIRVLAVTPLQLQDLHKHIYPFTDAASLIPINNHFLWMDLSQPERLNLPFLSFGIPVLAIIVLVTTYLQQKLMTPVSADSGEQGAQMMKAMTLYMPFFMGYLALTFASGLSLYFIAGNLISILQYALMGKLNWSNLIPGKKETLAKPALQVEQASQASKVKVGQKPHPEQQIQKGQKEHKARKG